MVVIYVFLCKAYCNGPKFISGSKIIDTLHTAGPQTAQIRGDGIMPKINDVPRLISNYTYNIET